MSTLRLDDDFRSNIEAAVAYRMVEIFAIPAEEARMRVRDFSIYGHNSPHEHEVLRAGYDLFKPVVSAAMPFLRSLMQATIVNVQDQIQRGEAAENLRKAVDG